LLFLKKYLKDNDMLHKLNPITQFTQAPSTFITTDNPQISAGQGSVTAALPRPTNQWITLPPEIWTLIFNKMAITSDPINLSNTCQFLYHIYQREVSEKKRQRQHDTLIHNLTTPKLHQQLYHKVINRGWGEQVLPRQGTEEWEKCLTQPLDSKLRGEDYCMALIKKLCIVGWDLLLTPQVLNNRLLVADLMRLLGDLSHHIQYPEVYVKRLFPYGFDWEFFHHLTYIHLDRCIQLVARYFPVDKDSAAHEFTARQVGFDKPIVYCERPLEDEVISLLQHLKTGSWPSVLYSCAVTTLGTQVNRIRILLKQGCDLEQRDMEGQTALHQACRYGDFDTIRLLLEHGADCNATDNRGDTPLIILMSITYQFNKIDLFLALPDIDVNTSNNEGKTALHKAAQQRYSELIEALLKHPAIDVNLKTYKGFSALDYAIDHLHFTNLQHLLCHPKIDTSASQCPLLSALYFAIEHHSLSGVEGLLPAVQGRDNHVVAFNYAVWRQKDDVAALFLQNMDEQNRRIFVRQALARACTKFHGSIKLRLHEKYDKCYDLRLYP
jgi:hypothetical protein